MRRYQDIFNDNLNLNLNLNDNENDNDNDNENEKGNLNANFNSPSLRGRVGEGLLGRGSAFLLLSAWGDAYAVMI